MRVLVGAWLVILAASSVFALDDQEIHDISSGGGFNPCAGLSDSTTIYPELLLFDIDAHEIILTPCDLNDAWRRGHLVKVIVPIPFEEEEERSAIQNGGLPNLSRIRWIDVNGREVDGPRASGVYFHLIPGQPPEKVIHVRD